MTKFKPGDPTKHLRREIVATFHGTIPNSQPSPNSADLLCRVKIDGVFYLRRLSEVTPIEPGPVDVTHEAVEPIEGIFGEVEV